MFKFPFQFKTASGSVLLIFCYCFWLAYATSDSDDSVTFLNTTDGVHDQGEHNDSDHHHSDHIHVASWNYGYVQKPILITFFIVILNIIKVLFHHAKHISEVVPESCLLIILGVFIGFLFLIEHAQTELEFVHFKSQTFFLYLLPPIILEAAYSLRDRAFLENLGTIMLYAVVGTLLNIVIVGCLLFGLYKIGLMGASLKLFFLECLIFSAVVAAVDPVAVLAIFQELGVNKTLYFLVFGESLFNDAVTVVAYNIIGLFTKKKELTIDDYGLGLAKFILVSVGGFVIGILSGLATAFITKYTTKVRVVEPIIMFGMAYLSYLVAELFHFSGIISIICCGIVQSHYAVENISSKSYISVYYFSKVASGLSESLIFIILGVMLVNDYKSWLSFNAAFAISGLLLCILSRFVVVYLLAFMVNKILYGIRKINKQEQFVMAYGGLRGAVTFSLIFMLDKKLLGNDQSKKDLLLTSTYIIIFFTTFLQGITIKPLVKLMRIRLQANDCSIYKEINRAVLENGLAGVEEVIGHKGTYYWTVMSKRISRRFLRPLVQKYPQKSGNRLVAAYQEIELQKQLSVVSEPNASKPSVLINELDAFDTTDLPKSVSGMRLDLQDEYHQNLQKQQSAERKRRAEPPPLLHLDSRKDLLQFRDMLQHTPNKTIHYAYDPNLSNIEQRQKGLLNSIYQMATARSKQKSVGVRKQLIQTALLPLGMGLVPAGEPSFSKIEEEVEDPETSAEMAQLSSSSGAVTFSVDEQPKKDDDDGRNASEKDPLC